MTILDCIRDLVREAVEKAHADGSLPPTATEDITIERPQKAEHGDFACSLPMKLARQARRSPMSIAETLAGLIPAEGPVGRVWAAPPGFVNVALDSLWLAGQVESILSAGESYGAVDVGEGRRVQVEFVSVNPNGPLHVGHARGAVFGSALANVLEAAGYRVEREYYVNDGGHQMELFYRSLYVRYLQGLGRDAELPEEGYRGQYVVDLARQVIERAGDRFANLPEEEALSGLGELGLELTLAAIRADMDRIRVGYDVWFSESSLYSGGQYREATDRLAEAGYLTERDGATWFTSTALGDDQDKVFVRSSGAPTYFAADVAYHYDKFFRRRFDRVIDVMGADHQGHVRSMKAVAKALGVTPERLDLLVYQLVTLKRGQEVLRLSTRTGELITLQELVDEVGPDACRFVFLSRSPESQMEFDLDLAKAESSENPVYYVQYAHARIAGILRLARERGIEHGGGDVSLLSHEAELALIRKLVALPELVEGMARSLEPHHLPHYAVELATAFHWFYQQCRVVSSAPEDAQLTRARLKLAEAARLVLSRCLKLMIMEAPESM